MRPPSAAVAGLAALLLAGPAAAEPPVAPAPPAEAPDFAQRLHSGRWEVRYGLLGELTGRDAGARQALERLVRDPNPRVANQALVRLLDQFVRVDRSLFDVGVYLGPGGAGEPLEDLSPRELVAYCLREPGRGPVLGAMKRLTRVVSLRGAGARPLADDLAPMENPRTDLALTIIGLVGEPGDAAALRPSLDAENDYVALTAAKAAIRLGDEPAGVATLLRLARQEPGEHLHYVTEALYALRELRHPDLQALVRSMLARVDAANQSRPGGVQLNWLNSFLRLAADVLGEQVWDAPAAPESADGPEAPTDD